LLFNISSIILKDAPDNVASFFSDKF